MIRPASWWDPHDAAWSVTRVRAALPVATNPEPARASQHQFQSRPRKMAAARPTIVRVLEFERVPLPERWNTAVIRERFEQTALKTGARAFQVRGRQLYSLGVVGVVELGGLTIEILPKTHDNCEPTDCRLFLSDLLRFGGMLPNFPASDAHTATGERTMLEIILTWAARQASANIHEGLPRRYVFRQELSTAVRGRIELQHLARRTPGKDFELLIRHSPLSENNPISRIVKWLLYEICRRTRLIATQNICKRLLQDLGHVGDVTPSVNDVTHIVLQPMESRWKPLLDFAALLIHQISPTQHVVGRTTPSPFFSRCTTFSSEFSRACSAPVWELTAWLCNNRSPAF